MKALWVQLHLDSPVLITGIGNGDENSGRTLPYIPGAVLRGALIARYQPKSGDLPVDETAAALFFNGKVRYLNAYPVLHGQRALPLPASWRTNKGDQLKDRPVAYDLALGVIEDEDMLPERIKAAFCGGNESVVEVFKPRREIHVHIGGEERGEVRKGSNTVFQYEALAAGQAWAALIVADDDVDLTRLRQLLAQDTHLSLGGSRSAGYGQVTISQVREGSALETPVEDVDEVVTVTLLSDALLRDASGQPTLDLDLTLSAHLGRVVRRKSAYVNVTPAGGFNRQWQAPLPQCDALGMGTVFTYRADELSVTELQPLVEKGVGERRVDGYGRLAVNAHGQAQLRVGLPRSDEAIVPKGLSPSSRALAQEMAERMLRARLDDRLITQLNQPALRIHNSPPNHQLNRLRTVIARALSSPALPLQPVSDYFGDKQMKDTARKKFERARVPATQERLITWIQDRLEKIDGLAQIGAAEHQSPSVAGQQADFSELLKHEYTLRLIDGVLKQAMKANRREEGEA